MAQIFKNGKSALSRSAADKIKRLCFTPNGVLRTDFDDMFNDVVTEEQKFSGRPSAIRMAMGIRNCTHFNRYYLAPMLSAGLIERTDPEHPRSPQQRYRLA